jgi:hypothetical protein
MAQLRPYLLVLAACVAIEGGIYYLLLGLGASEDLVVWVEMIWLCVAVIVTVAVGGHFDHWEDPDDR